jgi:LPXTG-motif cell wall-anchored protein
VFARHGLNIIRKTSPLDQIGFEPGIGTIFVNGAGQQLGNPTGAKDPVDVRSGLVILASDTHAWSYRHAEMSLGPPVADPADQVPPTPPPSMQAQVLSPETVALSWAPASDGDRWVPGGTGVPVSEYVVSRNGVEVATVTSTGMQDQVRAAADAAEPTVIEYSVTAVDASGNRSPAATLTVELPATDQSRTLVLVAIGLLGLAGVLVAGYLLYRRAVARGTRLPYTPQPSREDTRPRTPVA